MAGNPHLVELDSLLDLRSLGRHWFELAQRFCDGDDLDDPAHRSVLDVTRDLDANDLRAVLAGYESAARAYFRASLPGSA